MVYGAVATSGSALLALVAGQRVLCRPLGRDHYDRVLAKCWAGRIEINDALVHHGVAWAFRCYSLDYVDAQQEARRENRGVWVAPNLPPWLWRRRRRCMLTPGRVTNAQTNDTTQTSSA